MRIKEFDFDIDDADDNGLFTVQAVAGAGALTLDGALISGGTYTSADGLAHRIDQITAGNDAGITFTYVGTDANGEALTEVLAGGAGTPSTETTTGYFKTITSITASGAAAGNVTIGTTDEVASKTIPIDAYSSNGAMIGVNVTGTVNYTVQQATNNVLAAGTTPNWIAVTALSAKTTDLQSVCDLGVTAVRMVVNSYTNSAELQMNVNQSSGC